MAGRRQGSRRLAVALVFALITAPALVACASDPAAPPFRLRSIGRPASADETPLAFRTRIAMERIVARQLAQPDFRRRRLLRWQQRLPFWRRFQAQPVDLYDWNHGVLYQGLIAFAHRSGEAAPADLVAALGRENGWEIGAAPWRSFDHPDDFAVAGAYLALEMLLPDQASLAPLRSRVRRVIAAGRPSQPWWVDAIAMAPPTWAVLACRDSDPAPLRLAADRSLETGRSLFNPARSLFFRDRQARRQALAPGGQPVFWGRGNGWAVAGLAAVLARLPAADPAREPLLRFYRDTLASLMARRTGDAQLPSDLLHPERGGETTATALLVLAAASGLNNGLLERGRWQAATLHSWDQLLERVSASGDLQAVQPPASAPGPTLPRSRHPFAAGVVLLAGEEVLRLLSAAPPREHPGC